MGVMALMMEQQNHLLSGLKSSVAASVTERRGSVMDGQIDAAGKFRAGGSAVVAAASLASSKGNVEQSSA